MAAASPLLPPELGLVLIGYRATGKTTVGRIVAERLGRPFLDADVELEARTGRSIPQIFASEGETAFRDLEERTLGQLCEEFPGAVLATGGGAILRESNRRRLSRFGRVAWLAAPAGTLVERLRLDAGGRPALTDAGLLDEVAHILERREPLYRSTADLIIDASAASPERVAASLLDCLAASAPRDRR